MAKSARSSRTATQRPRTRRIASSTAASTHGRSRDTILAAVPGRMNSSIIASSGEAIQRSMQFASGLLRRFAPRNDKPSRSCDATQKDSQRRSFRFIYVKSRFVCRSGRSMTPRRKNEMVSDSFKHGMRMVRSSIAGSTAARVVSSGGSAKAGLPTGRRVNCVHTKARANLVVRSSLFVRFCQDKNTHMTPCLPTRPASSRFDMLAVQ